MLRLYEYRVLRRIFGAKQREVKGEGRKLLNEELNDLNSSKNIVPAIKSMSEMGGACRSAGRG